MQLGWIVSLARIDAPIGNHSTAITPRSCTGTQYGRANHKHYIGISCDDTRALTQV
jgi:hypothetical protein